MNVNKKAGYSPGKWTERYRLSKDEIREFRNKRLRDPQERKKLNERKQRRLREEYQQVNQEDVSYDPGCSRFDFEAVVNNQLGHECNY